MRDSEQIRAEILRSTEVPKEAENTIQGIEQKIR
jgi:hypothetical protein